MPYKKQPVKKAKKKSGPSWQQPSHQDGGLDLLLEKLEEIKTLIVGQAPVDPEPDEGPPVA